MRHVTIIDDDIDTLDCYKVVLGEHFALKLINNPFNLFEFLKTNQTDIILLDFKMPQMNGLDFYKDLKKKHVDIPVIFLTSLCCEDLIVEGLNLGAQDFIVKPISTAELVARIQNKLGKIPTVQDQGKGIIKIQNLILNCDTQMVEINGQTVFLTPIEFKFIYLLATNPNRIFNRDYISKFLWPDVHVGTQNIDTHLSNMRKKLGPSIADKIITIRSRGYLLRP